MSSIATSAAAARLALASLPALAASLRRTQRRLALPEPPSVILGRNSLVQMYRIPDSAEVELLDAVPKSLFYPQPEVDSVIVCLTPWKAAPFEVKDASFFRRMVRWLFTQRNKKLSNALPPFLKSTFKTSKEDAEKLACAFPFCDKRVRELSPKDFGVLADALVN